jgi:hypothetical protein
MRSRRTRAGVLTLVLAALACTRGEILPLAPTPTASPSPTSAAPTATPSPSLTPTLNATFTLTPTPTDTPLPTATPVPTAEIRLRQGPAGVAYLVPLMAQHLTPHAALLYFHLYSPSAGYLIYRQLPAASDVWMLHPLEAGASRHQITLEGLQADTRYEIQVALGEDLQSLQAPQLAGQPWGPLAVRTPPEGEPSLRIGVIGDSGFGEEITDALIARMAQQNLDFVLHTGDLMYRPEEESDPPLSYALKFFLPFRALLTRMPVYPALGNHDVDPPTRWEGEPYYYLAFPGFVDPALGAVRAQPGPGWFAFSYGSTQFLVLNSQVFHGEPGREVETAWLSERLADPVFAATLVVMHVPPFSSGRYGNDGRASRIDWVPLFEQDSVPLVMAGHDHNYQRLHFNGITYLISGGGSSVLYGQTVQIPGSDVFTRQSHFVLLEIDAGVIHISAIDEEGEVLDRATIEPQS